jgi:TfoX/Sxy family transcriptional regulator of competence genes
MASSQQNVDFILEQLTDAGDVSARKMFGEYAIYRRDKVVALFCDDQLFVKPTVGGKAFIGKVKEAPPYPGAKPCFLITGDQCEDGEWLSELILITDRELPVPKPKPPLPRPGRRRPNPQSRSLRRRKLGAPRNNRRKLKCEQTAHSLALDN